MPDPLGVPPAPLAMAVAVLATLALGLAWAPARAQVSPGPLARAHGAIDQPSQCFRCHARGGGMTQRCLDCHTGIAAQRRSGRGLHGREARAKDCAVCHPDHAGREFAMVRWEEGSPERFDHRRTGYVLTGRHAGLSCRACHQPKLQRPAATAPGDAPEPAHRFLGLDTACRSCHEDPHRNRFGSDCAKCHTTRDWKTIGAGRFDHALTRYPLGGRHASVRCGRCHDPASPTGKKPPFDRCGACHADAHAGQAMLAGKPADCEACHSVQGFELPAFTVAMHRHTRYPLDGRHADVRCAACHPKRPPGPASAALGPAPGRSSKVKVVRSGLAASDPMRQEYSPPSGP